MTLLLLPVHWLYELVSKVNVVSWQDPGLREEVKLFLERSFHPHQVTSEVVFTSDGVHAWIVVDFLPRIELRKEVRGDAQVVPAYIPLLHELLVMLTFANGAIMVLRVLSQFVTEDFAGNFFDNVVLSAIQVHIQRPTFLFLFLFFIFLWLDLLLLVLTK